MDGYDQALLMLGAILILGMGGLFYLVARIRRLDASIRVHEAMLVEQRAHQKAALHPAE